MAKASPNHDPNVASDASNGVAWGLVCALREELGTLRRFESRSFRRIGLEVHELDLGGVRMLACVGGVGKVCAARAATVLVNEGATRGLLVVGVCGGLRQNLAPGTLVHCTRAVQTDFAHRDGRGHDADVELRSAWHAVAAGPAGWFLTADRPVLSLWRRLRLARAFAGPCVADMETAAIASVATAAGVRWAALRAVTDRATVFGAASFKLHFPSQAGRCADTVVPLLAELARRSHD
jgi:adenosylhomocysteine nucleosidase